MSLWTDRSLDIGLQYCPNYVARLSVRGTQRRRCPSARLTTRQAVVVVTCTDETAGAETLINVTSLLLCHQKRQHNPFVLICRRYHNRGPIRWKWFYRVFQVTTQIIFLSTPIVYGLKHVQPFYYKYLDPRRAPIRAA